MYPNKPPEKNPDECVRLGSVDCPIDTFDPYWGMCNSDYANYCNEANGNTGDTYELGLDVDGIPDCYPKDSAEAKRLQETLENLEDTTG